MNILMMTNTFTPIVGGLEKSIQIFTQEFRKRGHRVVIVAPTFEGMPADEPEVIRVPAVQHFNGTDFSVQLPIPGFLSEAISRFQPDLIHSHHPFLIGDTALRAAYQFNVPLVFTNHTLFEYNTHYVSDSQALKRFVIQLSAGYANLADQVFVPSAGISALLRQQGVESPIEVVPTGVEVTHFMNGSSEAIRKKLDIPAGAFVVGYIGRLAPEKNLEFLARAVSLFLQKRKDACFLVVGKGPSEEIIQTIFKSQRVNQRLFLAGILENEELADAYRAMDVFAFASQSETQGIALVEAMAAGVPVVAVDACGIHDLIDDGSNGILLKHENETEFAGALDRVAGLTQEERKAMSQSALSMAKRYSRDICAEKALSAYAALMKKKLSRRRDHGYVWGDSVWAQTLRKLRAEWELVKNVTKAAAGAMIDAEKNNVS